MIKLILSLLLLTNFLALETSAITGTEAEEVESVIISLFDAMRASDGNQIRSLVTEDAKLHTVTLADGEPILRETRFDLFITSVGHAEPGTLDEQLTSVQVNIDENLATAWMEYRFYVAGKFSHCGVNTMNLIRKSDGWKIFSIVDTRRSENC